MSGGGSRRPRDVLAGAAWVLPAVAVSLVALVMAWSDPPRLLVAKTAIPAYRIIHDTDLRVTSVDGAKPPGVVTRSEHVVGAYATRQLDRGRPIPAEAIARDVQVPKRTVPLALADVDVTGGPLTPGDRVLVARSVRKRGLRLVVAEATVLSASSDRAVLAVPVARWARLARPGAGKPLVVRRLR